VERDLEPTEEEIDAYVERMKAAAKELKAAAPSRDVEELPDTVYREAAREAVLRFKIDRSLYEEYGGRVIFQQLGPEPIDAFREFLEERQEVGAFRILDPDLVDGFWEYLVDDSIHSFFPPEEAERAMSRPWWERSDEDDLD